MQENEKKASSIVDELLDEIRSDSKMEDISSHSASNEVKEEKKEVPVKESEPTKLFKVEIKEEMPEVTLKEKSEKIKAPNGFEQARKKKVAEFELQKNVENKRAGSFSGNRDDYESVMDAKPVSDDLNARFNSAKNIMTLSIVLFFISFAVNLLPFVTELIVSYSQTALLIVNTLLVVCAAAVNYSTVLGGFYSFIRFKADIDSPLAVASAATVGAHIALFLGDAQYVGTYFTGISAVLCAAFAVNNFAKLMLIRRIRTNFNLVANDRRKYAVTEIHGDEAARLTDSKVNGVIAFRKPTINLLNFLNNSFSDDPVSRMYRVMSYFLVLVSCGITAFGVYKGKVGMNVTDILTVLCSVLLFVCPFAALLSAGVPISINNRKLRKRRIILNGFGSVRRFAECSAVALTTKELFPKNTIQLVSFDLEQSADLEQTLTFAAALLKKDDSALSGILDGCFDSSVGPLPEVQDIERVSTFGVAGMVNNTPVIVGSAQLMDKFGIKGYDTTITGKVNRFHLYISIGGKLSAQLIIRYIPDKNIAKSLKLLADYGKRIVLSSDDINVSHRLVTTVFELDENVVTVLSDDAKIMLSQYEQFEESVDGSIGFFGKTSDFIDAIICCLRLRTCYAITKGIHIIFAVIAAAVAFVLMYFGFGFSALLVLGFQAVTSVLSTLLPMFISRD